MLKILLHWSSLCSFVERTDGQKAGNTFKVALKFKAFREFQKQYANLIRARSDSNTLQKQKFAMSSFDIILQ